MVLICIFYIGKKVRLLEFHIFKRYMHVLSMSCRFGSICFVGPQGDGTSIVLRNLYVIIF